MRNINTGTIDFATMTDACSISGAWLAHQHDELGRIEVGRLTDGVFHDCHLFAIAAEKISATAVEQKIFDGRVVYDRMLTIDKQVQLARGMV